VDSMLASGTRVRGIFFGRRNPQRVFLREGSKAVYPMSQICGILKIPVIYTEVGIAGKIYRPSLARFRPSLTEVSHVA
jgi:hypothetical protein